MSKKFTLIEKNSVLIYKENNFSKYNKIDPDKILDLGILLIFIELILTVFIKNNDIIYIFITLTCIAITIFFVTSEIKKQRFFIDQKKSVW